jgi:hypothetical protein
MSMADVGSAFEEAMVAVVLDSARLELATSDFEVVLISKNERHSASSSSDESNITFRFVGLQRRFFAS